MSSVTNTTALSEVIRQQDFLLRLTSLSLNVYHDGLSAQCPTIMTPNRSLTTYLRTGFGMIGGMWTLKRVGALSVCTQIRRRRNWCPSVTSIKVRLIALSILV